MNLFPFWSLSGEARELGPRRRRAHRLRLRLRAGAGRLRARRRSSPAQFYGTDMTVLKVMFSAIVTAMLGTVVLSGLGLMDLRAVADFATVRPSSGR